ncbi:MAG: hypothetical protein E7317_02970 [Clostridiales bacterium]|nr:hypothetical protein [Clostridiales bacterium]
MGAEFGVVISELNNASTQTKNQAEAFREAAAQLLTATTQLTEAGAGWDDDASQVFREKIEELKNWCDQMAGIVDTYAAALTKIGTTYQDADAQAASQFKR